MPKPKQATVNLQPRFTIREDTSEDVDQNHASDVDRTEEDTASAGDESSSGPDSSEEEEVEDAVAEEMERFLDTFNGLEDRYRLINRIGEGMSGHMHE